MNVNSQNNKMPDIKKEQLNSASSDRFERRQQKKTAQKTEVLWTHRKRVFKIIGYLILGLAVVVGGVWLLVRASSPKGPDYSQAIPLLGRNHIADGTHASYNSNPPTSGDHYAVPAPAQFYDKELTDEQLVHNLEHGHVWIAYKPELSAEIIKVLKSFAGNNIIITPRDANDFDIALVAWGRLDKFNATNGHIDTQRIKDFIIRYQNQGPENISSQIHLSQ